MKEWYVLHTHASAEQYVADQLERKEIETFLPKMTQKGRSGQPQTVALFPGYLFVRFDYMTANPDHWRWTPGLRRLVTFEDCPIPVPADVVATLKQRVVQLNSRGQRAQSRFEIGEQVRLKDGPFKEMLALFDGPVAPAEWVHVLLQTMNHSMRLRVAAASLEKVEPEKQSDLKRPRRTRGKGRLIRSS